jgi:hypothetical protein
MRTRLHGQKRLKSSVDKGLSINCARTDHQQATRISREFPDHGTFATNYRHPDPMHGRCARMTSVQAKVGAFSAGNGAQPIV